MIKNFNDSVVLTSQYKEAILVIEQGGSPGYVLPTYNINTPGVSSFYINGVDISKTSDVSIKTCIKLNAVDSSNAVFHLFTKSCDDYDINLRFNLYTSEECTTLVGEAPIDVSIFNRPFNIEAKNFNLYPNDKIIVDNESSYLVLRTNPKFSGNIKLIVDSDDNLYLDTFKVSDILSNKKYRKQQVSANSSFSADIRRVFGSIPSGELYKVDKENTLDIALPKTSIDKQYNTTYNYGARLFEDDLYTEDYSILAPIWINSTLPDFFAVFRLDGAHNSETYNDNNLLNIASKYFKESTLIKSWSINQKNNLGKYLYTHLNENKNSQSPVYLPLSDYDHNVWNGISVKNGIISSSQETSYQFEKSVDNFTEMNAFISTGFERNNILCPNLINIEYAFNDESASMYSMHRYFGLYLSENIICDIAYYKESETATSFKILATDASKFDRFIVKDNNSTNSIFALDGTIHPEFKNRIFVLNNNNALSRILSSDQLDQLNYVNKLCNKTSNNIFSTNVEKKKISQFITVDLKNNLLQGDHFRIINKSKNIIWEIYGINEDNIIKEKAFEYCSKYNDNNEAPGYPTIYRTAFSIGGDINNQVIAIKRAFDLFNDFEVLNYFSIVKNNNNSFSVIIDENCLDSFSFQHITSQQEISTNNFNNTSTYINFFGQINAENLYHSIDANAYYGPINFEYHGNRNSVIVDFIHNENNIYSLLDNVTDKFQPFMYYQNVNGWNKLVQTFDVSINGNSIITYQYISDPTSEKNNYIINTEDDISLLNNKLHIYDVLRINISLMSVNSVKDFDFNVYDDAIYSKKSEYFYKRSDDKLSYFKTINKDASITERNSYLITQGSGNIEFNGISSPYNVELNGVPFSFNTFFDSAIIHPSSSTIISYSILDGSRNFVGYNDSYCEESKNNYYIKDSSSTLKYSLTSPYVTKWVMQGLDCRNNEMRIILDSSYNKPFNINDSDASTMSNFIPVLDNSIFSNEISFPSFKYLSSSNETWKDYIYYDVNDSISDGSTYISVKDAMTAYPYIDVFSKLMFSNNNVNIVKNRSSILSYNKYKNSIDTIYSGLKLSISSNKNNIELSTIETYNRYKFGFISTSSRNYSNNKPIEVIINENTKTILMIWYQGNDVLNHYYRNSSYSIGKSILNDVNVDKKLNSFYYGSNIDNNFVKTPFWLNTSAHGLNTNIINSNKISFGSDSDQISPLVQMAINKSNIGSVFVCYTKDNSVNNGIFVTTPQLYNKYYNFNGYFQYDSASTPYWGSKSTVGIGVINHTNTYNSNKNLYVTETCDVNLLNNLLNKNEVFYTVIRKDKIYDNNTFKSESFKISIIEPKIYKNKFRNHNGGFYPKFNNILNFASNEEYIIIDIAKKDFISSNTNLSSYNNISQLWNNKIVNSVSDQDIVNNDAISYEPDYNTFKSMWDKDFFKIYTDSSISTKINGYESPIEMPTFFGSKLIKLPHTLILNKWDNSNSSAVSLNNDVMLKFNLSLTLRRNFKNESNFIANWMDLSNSSQYIDQYINNTILNYYSINLTNLKVKLYSKNEGNLSISASHIDGMDEISNQNFYSDLIYDKGEYFYLINIKNTYDNLSYYAEITINQK